MRSLITKYGPSIMEGKKTTRNAGKRKPTRFDEKRFNPVSVTDVQFRISRILYRANKDAVLNADKSRNG